MTMSRSGVRVALSCWGYCLDTRSSAGIEDCSQPADWRCLDCLYLVERDAVEKSSCANSGACYVEGDMAPSWSEHLTVTRSGRRSGNCFASSLGVRGWEGVLTGAEGEDSKGEVLAAAAARKEGGPDYKLWRSMVRLVRTRCQVPRRWAEHIPG